jgi:hypothetical protein
MPIRAFVAKGEDSVMAVDDALTNRSNSECCFIEGYFAQQFAAGVRPDYGYPKNHLPQTTIQSMEVVTGFMAKPKNKAK